MKTAKEFLQNKYPQMRGEKWNSNEVINDEWIAQMMEEYAAQFKYDFSKTCECKDSPGETWCCNHCGLPFTKK